MELIKAPVRPGLIQAKSSKIEFAATPFIYGESSAAVLQNAAYELLGLGFRCRYQGDFDTAAVVRVLRPHALSCAFDILALIEHMEEIVTKSPAFSL